MLRDKLYVPLQYEQEELELFFNAIPLFEAAAECSGHMDSDVRKAITDNVVIELGLARNALHQVSEVVDAQEKGEIISNETLRQVQLDLDEAASIIKTLPKTLRAIDDTIDRIANAEIGMAEQYAIEDTCWERSRIEKNAEDTALLDGKGFLQIEEEQVSSVMASSTNHLREGWFSVRDSLKTACEKIGMRREEDHSSSLTCRTVEQYIAHQRQAVDIALNGASTKLHRNEKDIIKAVEENISEWEYFALDVATYSTVYGEAINRDIPVNCRHYLRYIRELDTLLKKNHLTMDDKELADSLLSMSQTLAQRVPVAISVVPLTLNEIKEQEIYIAKEDVGGHGRKSMQIALPVRKHRGVSARAVAGADDETPNNEIEGISSDWGQKEKAAIELSHQLGLWDDGGAVVDPFAGLIRITERQEAALEQKLARQQDVAAGTPLRRARQPGGDIAPGR